MIFRTPARRLVALVALAALSALSTACTHDWSDEEKAALRELRLGSEPVPPDPSNRFANDEGAARLGKRFFFDTAFSANGELSCATCHVPSQGFQDGIPLAKGVGTTTRRTMPLAGIASSSWFFWDGRKDSLWSQALGPLESEVEHGTDRVYVARLVAERYADEYERLFGPLPDLDGLPAHARPNGSYTLFEAWTAMSSEQQDGVNRVFANVGKAIAAYERKIVPGEARFDHYVDAVLAGDDESARQAFSDDEAAGLRLFLGKARCLECHNGPHFTNHDFANTGVPAVASLPDDSGRLMGAREVLQDEFNCLGPYSDAQPEDCRELRSLHVDEHTRRQYKVPSLRNVAERPPYMHAGQLASLAIVIEHYDRAPPAPRGDSEIAPLHLSAREREQLVSFLRTLSAPLPNDDGWLSPSALP